MSLLPSVPSGTPTQLYYMENCGTTSLPVIKGDSTGKILVGNQANGLVVRGDASGNGFVRGGKVSAGTMTLGSDGTSFNNIVLTPNTVTFNATSIVIPGGDVTVTGDMTVTGGLTVDSGITVTEGGVSLQDGDLALGGGTITGFVDQFSTRVGGGAVANPTVLPAGLYSVIVTYDTAGNEAAQASMVAYWSGAVWSGNGTSFNFTGGPPNVAIGPASGGATLEIGGAAIPSGTIRVRFRQLTGAA